MWGGCSNLDIPARVSFSAEHRVQTGDVCIIVGSLTAWPLVWKAFDSKDTYIVTGLLRAK